jgi:hypothetical protein
MRGRRLGIPDLEKVEELAGQSPAFLRSIHILKRDFGATLEKTAPNPALGSGVNAEPAYTVADARSGPPQGGS